MPLAPGTRLGPYEVIAQIGAGGMGEVYRARDARLKRDVALKVLPESLSADPDRLARFQREAEVLAALNHPNIAAIHGLEEAGDVRALVMELVEGPTLADRIAQGALPVDDALAIAGQIAEALEAAHEQGIVHRDLKPANIKVRPDGTVKVLDFGLAKAMEPVGALTPSVSQSPTITTPAMTQMGIILGTAAYMSPEQAKGRPADRRSDIWAFGCVLYEMLTGKRAFDAPDVAETLAAVLMKEPDWTALPPAAPTSLRRLLRRTLEKDRRVRLDSAVAARLEIAERTEPVLGPGVRESAGSALSRAGWLTVCLLGMVTLAASSVAVRHLLETSPAAETVRFRIDPPEGMTFAGGARGGVDLAVSPDGRRLVFVARTRGTTSLWVRMLNDPTSMPIPGTDGASFPFWSPDSASVGFFADEKLKTVQIAGGQPLTVADARRPLGGTWGRDGVILFSSLFEQGGEQLNGIQRVAASGGQAEPLPLPGGPGLIHSWPIVVPDGRHLLHRRYRPGETTQEIVVSALDGADRKTLLVADRASLLGYGAGRLFYWRDNNVFAQAFDVERLALVGDPVQVVDQVGLDRASGTGSVPFSVSPVGVMAYLQGEIQASLSQLLWVDRSGQTVETILEPGSYSTSLSMAEDGRRIAVSLSSGSPANRDVWVIDAARGVRSRLTTYPGVDASPVWSPGARTLAFNSTREQGLYVQNADGSGTAELLFQLRGQGSVSDWSRDGRFIIYVNLSAEGGRDLWIVPTETGGKPTPFNQTPYNEQSAMFSPDVRWIAYTSDESGRDEVYVQPFPTTGARVQISLDGGSQPFWRDDGRELFYVGLDGALMTVSVTPGSELGYGRPQRLFAADLYTASSTRSYAASRDGKRFLLVAPTESAARPVTVVINWEAPIRD
jgi:Tol biopolymer transport system component